MFTHYAIALFTAFLASPIAVKASRNDSATAVRACSQLKAAFPNNYVDPSSSGYTEKENVNWSANCRLPAACFFIPVDTKMVAQGLSIVTKAGSFFAVRNGGHNPNIKFASIDGSGVLIDLSLLRSLRLDNSIIYAGTGNKGGDVQKLADSKGQAGITGLDADVGISGLILGGGYTHFSQITGLVADNVVNFEVVLSDSRIVNANASHNSNLYRALRGGGNNFGIVTRLDMRTSPVRNIWYSLVAIDPTDYARFMIALTEIQKNMEEDPKANINILIATVFIQVELYYAEPLPEGETPAAFAPLYNLNISEIVLPPTNGTIWESVQANSPPEDDNAPVSAILNSVVHRPNADFYIALFEYLLQQSTPNSTNIVAIGLKPMGSRVAKVGKERAGGVANSLNIQPISQTWVSVGGQYENEGERLVLAQMVDATVEWMNVRARKSGLLLPNLFANDAASDQNVMGSYGPESLANLKAMSRKYDSTQAFQRLQAGGWKVSTA